MQILVNGFINGLTIGLIALAFNVVYLPARVFYVALAGIYTVTPFLVWTGLKNGYPWYLVVTAALLFGIFISIFFEVINHRFLENKRASSGAHLISSLGFYIIIVQIVVLIWGNQTKVIRTGVDSTLVLGSVIITYAQLTALIVSLIAVAGFYVWLKYTSIGLQFRALASNPVELALRGYNINILRIIAFGVSGFFCSIASLLVSYDVGFDPHGGLYFLLLGVVATVIGGTDSFFGPVFGGIMLGIVRSEVVWFLSARWQEAITFLLLSVFLFVRSKGIFGREERLEAEA